MRRPAGGPGVWSNSWSSLETSAHDLVGKSAGRGPGRYRRSGRPRQNASTWWCRSARSRRCGRRARPPPALPLQRPVVGDVGDEHRHRGTRPRRSPGPRSPRARSAPAAAARRARRPADAGASGTCSPSAVPRIADTGPRRNSSSVVVDEIGRRRTHRPSIPPSVERALSVPADGAAPVANSQRAVQTSATPGRAIPHDRSMTSTALIRPTARPPTQADVADPAEGYDFYREIHKGIR